MCDGTLPTGGSPPEKYSDKQAHNLQESCCQRKDTDTARTWQRLYAGPRSLGRSNRCVGDQQHSKHRQNNEPVQYYDMSTPPQSLRTIRCPAASAGTPEISIFHRDEPKQKPLVASCSLPTLAVVQVWNPFHRGPLVGTVSHHCAVRYLSFSPEEQGHDD
jgi:hypothetical protein